MYIELLQIQKIKIENMGKKSKGMKINGENWIIKTDM